MIAGYQNFDEEAFWQQLPTDMEQHTEGQFIIQSAYARLWRIKQFAPHLIALRNRGVTTCTFIQTPDNWQVPTNSLVDGNERMYREEFIACIRLLRNIGTHVTLRKDVHHKFVVIPKVFVYKGSLNALSHNRNGESMDRFSDPAMIEETVRKYKLDACVPCMQNRLKCGIARDGLPPKERTETLLKHIATIRNNLDLTQADLARLSGTRQSRISELENGYTDVQLSTYLGIIGALDFELVPAPKLYLPPITQMLVNERKSS